MFTLTKLTDTQARVIREAVAGTDDRGRTWMFAAWIKTANYKTYNRLFELGLITGSHKGACLTELGLNARSVLGADPYASKVLTGTPSYDAAVAEEAAAPVAEEASPVDTEERPVRYEVRPMYRCFWVVDRTDGSWKDFNILYAARDAADCLNRAADPIEWTDVQDETGVRHAMLVRDWPSGTRVSGRDGGHDRVGTVTGGDHGRVTNPNHPNFGRTYVGVAWDKDTLLTNARPRSRPFTDTLTKLTNI